MHCIHKQETVLNYFYITLKNNFVETSKNLVRYKSKNNFVISFKIIKIIIYQVIKIIFRTFKLIAKMSQIFTPLLIMLKRLTQLLFNDLKALLDLYLATVLDNYICAFFAISAFSIIFEYFHLS